MRYVLRTSYKQDTRFFKEGFPQYGWYLLWLGLALAAPWLWGPHLITQFSFMLIFAIIGLGYQILLGYTGLLSLGQAAFVAIGAYACLWLERMGVHFFAALPIAAVMSAVIGGLLGMPVLRLRGLYLAVATMAIGFIVMEVAARWVSVTGGNAGVSMPAIRAFGYNLGRITPFYFISLAIFLVALWMVANILRSSTGRNLFAVRDSDIAAQSMGIDVAWTKTKAFALSAFFAGLGGGLLAHRIGFISPEQFSLHMSIELALLVLIGGVGSLRGVVFGAAFIVMMPDLLAAIERALPFGSLPALQPFTFGLLLILVMMFEPRGINGLFEKVIAWFRLMPLYRKGMFARQRGFAKSERW